MKPKLNIPPPLSVLEQGRQSGMSPQEIYRKSAELAALRQPAPASPRPRRPRFCSRQIAGMYQVGQTLREIALALGCSHETVRIHLLRSGIALRPRSRRCRNIPAASLAAIVRLSGARQAGAILGISTSAVYNLMREYGIVIDRPIGCERCQSRPYARGLCKACYQKWLRLGKPDLA